ncbi:lactoylglutathione lyase [Jannaschia pagri]|uniref:Lactoylglutathione lyase n=1 Tax=Jannaschia pagri TaxID=2829797 RepID=A0ABQ4NHA9_9RHOB|nr:MULTISPECIES: VOC family protein [unclassified Jannaschia]GIT90295.1 lactoylglutathione lyase [Jannaschia sp. AI_61]GIT93599.1 lactoylglutathione lyase [Jannaschia sp. AI_62]
MIGYVTLGADDIAAAKRFYGAILTPLGYGLHEGPEGLSYALEEGTTDGVAFPEFYVKPTYDGLPASPGNGAMVAFDVGRQDLVRDLHRAGLSAGGTNEGAPGFRAAYSAHFYVGYLRDPQGNKIALYAEDRSVPGRDG